jgi:hypothetical protein
LKEGRRELMPQDLKLEIEARLQTRGRAIWNTAGVTPSVLPPERAMALSTRPRATPITDVMDPPEPSMAGQEVTVVTPDSPLVDAIVAREVVMLGRGTSSPLTAGQRLQSDRVLVAKILNICFWTSLEHEEGRPARSGVTFASPDDVSDQFALAEPELLTVASLIRLSMVAGTSRRLAICERNGAPYIWGFLRDHPPFLVTIWFDRPARLRVMMERAGVLCLLDRGQVRIPQNQRVANPWTLAVQLRRLLPTLLDGTILEGLTFIANEMCRHGHGGTLLLVPNSSADWEKDLHMRYRIGESSRDVLRQLHRRPEQITGPAFGLTAAFGDELLRVACQVADFTKIDGAAVLSTELAIIGFGARVTSPERETPKTALTVATIYEDRFHSVAWEELGGTRHQSAARFVASTRTSAAFVASHNGGLSALAWKEDAGGGHIQWLRGLEGLVAPR